MSPSMDKMEKTTEKKKGFVREFTDFLQTFGVIGLAIGFVIGVASSAVVNSLVKDLINPIVGLLAYGKPGVAKRDCYISGFGETVSIPLWRLHFANHLLHRYRSSGLPNVQA